MRIWDDAGRPVKVLLGHKGEVHAVEYSPDGRLLASTGKDRTARIWKTEDWSEARALEATSDGQKVRFQP